MACEGRCDPAEDDAGRPLRSRLALIAGGSSPWGRTLGEALADRGARVVLADSPLPPLPPGTMAGIDTALDSPSQLHRLFDDCRRAHGLPDLLVLALPPWGPAPLLQEEPDRLTASVAINRLAPIWIARAFLPGLLQAPRADVIFLLHDDSLLDLAALLRDELPSSVRVLTVDIAAARPQAPRVCPGAASPPLPQLLGAEAAVCFALEHPAGRTVRHLTLDTGA